MTTERITKAVIVAALVALVGYNVAVLVTAGSEATISGVIWEWGPRCPVVPAGIGVVCGHWFWPRRWVLSYDPWALAVAGVVIGIAGAMGFPPVGPTFAWYVAGVVAGGLYWGRGSHD